MTIKRRYDPSTRRGAQILADQIRAHWAKQGVDVITWVEEINQRQAEAVSKSIFSVRTNLVHQSGRPIARHGY